jgi:hypothetical protein
MPTPNISEAISQLFARPMPMAAQQDLCRLIERQFGGRGDVEAFQERYGALALHLGLGVHPEKVHDLASSCIEGLSRPFPDADAGRACECDDDGMHGACFTPLGNACF